MPNVSLGRRIAANAASAFAGHAVLSVLGLVATAVLVRTLGAQRFGAWSLVGAVVAYLGLFDLGLGVSLVRRIASRDDPGGAGEEASRAVGATLVAALALGSVAAVLVWPLAPSLSFWLHIAESGRSEFVAALRLGGVAAALALPGVVLGAVPTAFQRLDAVVRLETTVSAATMLAQAGVALSGGGLVGLALAAAAGRAASLAGRVVLARRLVGPLTRVDWRYPFWREVGRFGALKLIHQAASQLVLYLDRLLVGVLVSTSAVAYYTVALELAQRLLVVQQNIAAAYYPAACALVADRASFAQLYVRSSRAVSLLTMPLALGLAILAGPLLEVWVGQAFVPAAGLLRVVALSYGAMALTAVPTGAADALNRPEVAARYGLAGVVLNVGLALLLIPPLGALGAGWALALNVALQSPWFVRRVTRGLVGLSLLAYAREVLLKPLVPAVATGLVLGGALWAGGGQGALGLVAAATAGGVAFVAAIRLLRTFDSEERRFVAEITGGRMLRWVVGE